MTSPTPEPSERPRESAASRDAACYNIIEVHLREMSQLFESLDPSPFHEKDLDRNAEAYIIDSFKEFPTRQPCMLVLHVDQPPAVAEASRHIEEAIRIHFARCSRLAQRRLEQLLRRGFVSLGIGLAFLAAVFVIAQIVMGMMEGSGVATFAREGLLIVGWVAMWRPLEIFLYDWWPILGERRIHDQLSHIEVRIVSNEPVRSAP